MKLGKRQQLTVARIKEFGVYLNEDGEELDEKAVLLPKKEVPDGIQAGDKLDVFIYKDSSDRWIATMRSPILEVGDTGRLTVKDVTGIGAFLDNGLEKDILLPYKEMEGRPVGGDSVLVSLYVDRSERLAATMRVYKHLSITDIYKKDDEVSGTIYEIRDMGVFVAVDDKFFGFIPKSEVYDNYRIGEQIHARVLRVREDGKLDLSPRQKAYIQIGTDAEVIRDRMKVAGGKLPYNDKSDPEQIKKELGLSKNAFKRAVGHLLKEGVIEITDDGIVEKR